MRTLLVVILCASVLPHALCGLDLCSSIHVDTFGQEVSVGASFSAEEHILKKLKVRSKAEYLTARAYDLQTLVLGELSIFTIGGGFALELDNTQTPSAVPGISLVTGIQMTRRLAMELSGTVSLKSENILKLFGFKAHGKLAYTTDNATAWIKYTMQGAETRGFIHRLAAEVEAFENGFPFALLLGVGADFFLMQADQQDLKVNVTGGFLIPTLKYGTYFAKTKVGVLNLQDSSSIPFDIAVGARFSL